jgi:hypothetical protein
MWYFGTETTEVWVNTGNATFPFERDSAFIETGCLSKYSVVAFDNTIAFVDHRARVVKFNGYTPNVISTAEVERDLRRTKKAQRSEEIEGFVWFDAGREFYVLSGPDWTWVYDASTQLWHQKKSHLSTRWIGRGYIDAFDKHLIGSIEDGNLYEMSHDYKDEDGSPLIMDLRTSILGPWPARVSWQEIAIDMEMGVGNASDADPKVMISWSDDAGRPSVPSGSSSWARPGPIPSRSAAMAAAHLTGGAGLSGCNARRRSIGWSFRAMPWLRF